MNSFWIIKHPVLGYFGHDGYFWPSVQNARKYNRKSDANCSKNHSYSEFLNETMVIEIKFNIQ